MGGTRDLRVHGDGRLRVDGHGRGHGGRSRRGPRDHVALPAGRDQLHHSRRLRPRHDERGPVREPRRRATRRAVGDGHLDLVRRSRRLWAADRAAPHPRPAPEGQRLSLDPDHRRCGRSDRLREPRELERRTPGNSTLHPSYRWHESQPQRLHHSFPMDARRLLLRGWRAGAVLHRRCPERCDDRRRTYGQRCQTSVHRTTSTFWKTSALFLAMDGPTPR